MTGSNNNKIYNYILKESLKSGNVEDIKTIGFSMEPSLNQNDIISVKGFNNYSIGDIILFDFGNEGILVHRIIEIDESNIFCKGDNAFRIERISKEQVLGKVIKVNNIEIEKCEIEYVYLSKKIGDIFKQSRGSKAITQQTGIYRFYKQYSNDKFDNSLTYYLNPSMILDLQNETLKERLNNINGVVLSNLGIKLLAFLQSPQTYKNIVIEMQKDFDLENHEMLLSFKKELAMLIVNQIVSVS